MFFSESVSKTKIASQGIIPPFSFDDAVAKVRKAEDAWNTQDPKLISLAYSPDSTWRNRNEFVTGRDEIVSFLERKWRELDYRLIKEIWCHSENRIAVRFAYEWRDSEGNWYRSFGNENWKFDGAGLMTHRHASINDLAILPENRLFTWPSGPRPETHPSLTCLGL